MPTDEEMVFRLDEMLGNLHNTFRSIFLFGSRKPGPKYWGERAAPPLNKGYAIDETSRLYLCALYS